MMVRDATIEEIQKWEGPSKKIRIRIRLPITRQVNSSVPLNEEPLLRNVSAREGEPEKVVSANREQTCEKGVENDENDSQLEQQRAEGEEEDDEEASQENSNENAEKRLKLDE